MDSSTADLIRIKIRMSTAPDTLEELQVSPAVSGFQLANLISQKFKLENALMTLYIVHSSTHQEELGPETELSSVGDTEYIKAEIAPSRPSMRRSSKFELFI